MQKVEQIPQSDEKNSKINKKEKQEEEEEQEQKKREYIDLKLEKKNRGVGERLGWRRSSEKNEVGFVEDVIRR